MVPTKMLGFVIAMLRRGPRSRLFPEFEAILDGR
jgi:hypothetical protein